MLRISSFARRKELFVEMITHIPEIPGIFLSHLKTIYPKRSRISLAMVVEAAKHTLDNLKHL